MTNKTGNRLSSEFMPYAAAALFKGMADAFSWKLAPLEAAADGLMEKPLGPQAVGNALASAKNGKLKSTLETLRAHSSASGSTNINKAMTASLLSDTGGISSVAESLKNNLIDQLSPILDDILDSGAVRETLSTQMVQHSQIQDVMNHIAADNAGRNAMIKALTGTGVPDELNSAFADQLLTGGNMANFLAAVRGVSGLKEALLHGLEPTP